LVNEAYNLKSKMQFFEKMLWESLGSMPGYLQRPFTSI